MKISPKTQETVSGRPNLNSIIFADSKSIILILYLKITVTNVVDGNKYIFIVMGIK